MTYFNNKPLIAISLLLLFSFSTYGQRVYQKLNPKQELSCRKENLNFMINDMTYDVKHYYIDVEISINSEYIKGSVNIIADAVDTISFITLDLDNAYTITAIDGASSYTHSGDKIIVNLNNAVNAGDEFTIKVHYEGDPPLAGGYKGLRYETHDGNQPIIASLSTPYLAHTWWPCNDGTKDKADAINVDITIDDMMVAGIQMKAISNGVLDEVVPVSGGKLKYKWSHNYPIVPYYVMVAISNYETIEETYNNGSEEFPLIYYVFNSSISEATAGVADLPEVMDFFSEIFGPYPFADEKYGMTELGYYGGIENQTNTIINNMSTGWFMISVHELSHMWFADMITCADWHHGWLNEGFASYAEALWKEHSEGETAYHNYMSGFEYYDSGSVYMLDVSNPFNVFQSIIYDKGAYVLHMLRHVLGDAVFFEAIYAYANDPQYQYSNTTTEDFKTVCETKSGLDLSVFFDQWIYDEYYPIYQYDYYQDSDFNTIFGIQQTQGSHGKRPVFEMPVDVKFTFTDGSTVTEVVQNTEIYQTFSFSYEKEIAAVSLDPNKWILKQANQTNMALSIETNPLSKSLQIYPNPTQSILTISLTDSNIKLSRISVINGQGAVLDQLEINEASKKSFTYDTSKLATGIYYLQLQFKKGLVSQKFVVK